MGGGTQLIQSGIESGPDDPSFTDKRRRLVHQRGAEPRGQFGQRVQAGAHSAEQVRGQVVRNSEACGEHRDALEGLRERGKVPRISGGAPEPRGCPLDVADLGQPRTEVPEKKRVFEKGCDGVLAGFDLLHGIQRVQHPLAKEPGPHRCRRPVQCSKKRHAPPRAGGNKLEVALRRGVENEVGAAAVGTELPEVPGLSPHLAGNIMEKSPGRSDSSGQIPASKSVEGLNFEMAEQDLRRGLGLEKIAVHHGMLRERSKKRGLMLGNQNLCGADTRQLIEQRDERLQLGEPELAGAQVRERETIGAVSLAHGGQVIRLPVIESEIVQRSRTENLRYLAADEFPGGHLADLIADCYPPARSDQFFNIPASGMERNPAHRRRPAFGQSHIQDWRGRLGILTKHFVKIPQPEHQQCTGRQIAPHGVILLHHRGDCFCGHR